MFDPPQYRDYQKHHLRKENLQEAFYQWLNINWELLDKKQQKDLHWFYWWSEIVRMDAEPFFSEHPWGREIINPTISTRTEFVFNVFGNIYRMTVELKNK